MRETTIRNAVRLAALTLFLGMAIGCGVARGPNSAYVPPPADPERDRWTADLELLQADSAAYFPKTGYFLGAGDVFTFTLVGRADIIGREEATGEVLRFTVTEDPAIVFPYIGAVRVHGKSPAQLQEELGVAYAAIIHDPVPVLTVEKFHANQFVVVGSVREPGRYPLQPGDTVIDAVFRAGGLSLGGRNAELPPARVLKVYREKTTLAERTQLTSEELMERFREEDRLLPREEFVIPLDEFLLGGDLRHNIPLHGGDLIYIPPAGTVTVHGPVKTPKVVFIGPGLRTVAQIITECGGMRYRAGSRIELVRRGEDGSTESIFLNARRIMKRQDPDFYLQDNDQVFVYSHPTRTVLDALGAVFSASANTGVNATYSPVP